jgi:hypothetical protein
MLDYVLWNCSVFNAARDRNEINSHIMKIKVEAAMRLFYFLKEIGVYTSTSEEPRCQKEKKNGKIVILSWPHGQIDHF